MVERATRNGEVGCSIQPMGIGGHVRVVLLLALVLLVLGALYTHSQTTLIRM